MTRRGAVLFAALCLAWGIPYLLIKVAVTEMSPVALVFVRTALGALLLAPFAFRRDAIRPVFRRWRPLIAFTVIEIAVPWLMLSDAEQHLTSSVSGLLVAAVPLVGAVIAILTGNRDRLGPMAAVGMLVGLLGVVALVGLDAHGTRPLAVVEMAGVAIGYAIGPVIMDRWLADVPALGVITSSLGLCALVYLPFAVPVLPDRMPRPTVLLALALLAVVCTAAAFLMMFGLVAEIGPVRATLITYVNPAVAVAAGVLLLGEQLTLATGVGFVLVIAGSVLATWRRAPGPAPEATSAEPARAAVHG
jgi:drug/metabolite transporter (DMT)-like permease